MADDAPPQRPRPPRAGRHELQHERDRRSARLRRQRLLLHVRADRHRPGGPRDHARGRRCIRTARASCPGDLREPGRELVPQRLGRDPAALRAREPDHQRPLRGRALALQRDRRHRVRRRRPGRAAPLPGRPGARPRARLPGRSSRSWARRLQLRHETETNRSGGGGPGEDRRRSLRRARPRGLLPRSGGRRVRPAQRADADRDELPRGRLAAAPGHHRGAAAREAARRRRLHGDRADRRPRRRPQARSKSSASGSSGRSSSPTPRRSTCTRATSAPRSSRSTRCGRPSRGAGPGPSGASTCAATSRGGCSAWRCRRADPARAGRALGAGLRARVRARAADGSHEIALDDGVIRFVADRDGRGEGVSGIDIAVADPTEVVHRARARGVPAARGRGRALRRALPPRARGLGWRRWTSTRR